MFTVCQPIIRIVSITMHFIFTRCHAGGAFCRRIMLLYFYHLIIRKHHLILIIQQFLTGGNSIMELIKKEEVSLGGKISTEWG